MAADLHPPSPQDRLAASRRALIEQLQGGPVAPGLPQRPPVHPETSPRHSRSALNQVAWGTVARGMLHRWWRRHPANAVGQLARPLVARYAREEPAKFVAIAAATGAVVVLVRPWRLLSATAVLAAIMKTSDVADLVNTLMQNNTNPRKDPP